MASTRRGAIAGERQARAIGDDILLHHHGIGIGRQHRAGEDADRFAGAERAGGRGAGGDFAGDRPRTGQIGKADRIAVHRRQRRRGLVAPCDDVLRKVAPGALRHADIVGAERRLQRQQPRLGLLDREQRAHAARQSPDRPPLFSSRRISPITMARSSAFAMS